MAKDKEKNMSMKEIDKKVTDLKIELLKQTQKRKSIKRQIARLLTMKNNRAGLQEKRARLPEQKTKKTKLGGTKQSAN